jgi:RNA polymerase sigma-70 factor (ECF subfamily)
LLRLRNPRDRESWITFVDIYGGLVYGHCRRRGLRHQDAEDVTQEVFARIGAAIRTFEYQPDLGRFRNWLGTLTRNEVYRFLKRSKDRTHGQGGENSDGTLEGLASRGEETLWQEEFNAHVLRTALARCRPHFDETTWRAFEKVWSENCPAPEVARELGRAIDWVYVAKSRVLKRLWQEVQELADDTAWAVLSSSPHE